MHKILNILTFQMIKKIGRFLIKQCPFTQILLNNLILFFPEFLVLFFTPKNTQGQKLKTFPSHHFLGNPVGIRKSQKWIFNTWSFTFGIYLISKTSWACYLWKASNLQELLLTYLQAGRIKPFNLPCMM